MPGIFCRKLQKQGPPRTLIWCVQCPNACPTQLKTQSRIRVWIDEEGMLSCRQGMKRAGNRTDRSKDERNETKFSMGCSKTISPDLHGLQSSIQTIPKYRYIGIPRVWCYYTVKKPFRAFVDSTTSESWNGHWFNATSYEIEFPEVKCTTGRPESHQN